MPSRRSFSFATLAALVLLASGLGGWLVSDQGATQLGKASVSAVRPSLPFRVVDGTWTAVAFVPSAEDGETLQPGLANPEDVVKLLRLRGFSEISEVRRRGETFICEATGPRRERVRLAVDARSGELSGMQVIGHADPRP